MAEKLMTIMHKVTNTVIIDKSEFITSLFPTQSVEESQSVIQAVRKEHYNATHNCSAYVLGEPITAQKSNDDGEPKGTAGMPMLQSLMMQNMTDVTAIVTRYYGGIKLGAGGLIRAYSSGVTEALNLAELATYEMLVKMSVTLSYEELNSLYHLRDTTNLFTLIEVTYGQELTAFIECLSQDIEPLTSIFTEQLLHEISFTYISEERKKFPFIKKD